ncbi:hypothetical protein BaRGS_00025169 [Batillaria attramentaria]|uniref:Uncharacterized protein n=1 Tax=Batillaria attramentaria TaxID=370345 RepID=A0ABD0K943_9CAEN
MGLRETLLLDSPDSRLGCFSKITNLLENGRRSFGVDNAKAMCGRLFLSYGKQTESRKGRLRQQTRRLQEDKEWTWEYKG